MVSESRSTRDIVISVETEVRDLKTHFNNHIKHDEDIAKENKRRFWAFILIATGALITTACSVVGLLVKNTWIN